MKLLLVILFFTLISRFALLGSFPLGLNADEAALGYNAYSFLLTGRDEHGHPIPVNLESFGDFKPALYSYLIVPLLVFGLPLSEITVRLPSAIFGTISVLLIYFLTNLIFTNLLIIKKLKLNIGHTASFLLAISPWAIHFSRGAWEVNVSTTFLLIGTLSFLKYLYSKNILHLCVVVIFFVLSMYTYQSARLIAPALGVTLLIINLKHLLKLKKHLFINLFLLCVALSPLLISTLKSDVTSRFSGVGLFSDIGPLNRVNELRGHYLPNIPTTAKILHNRYTAYSLQYLKNYLSHFDPVFLFISGDRIDRSRIPDHGLFYPTDFILIIIGMGVVFKILIPSHRFILGVWLLISPIAAAATFQVPHALRAHGLVIPLTILASLGLFSLIYFAYNSRKKIIFLLLICLISVFYVFHVSRFANQYLVHYPYQLPHSWQFGFKQVVNYVSLHKDKYKHIIMTNRSDQPYILFLFYLKYPPQDFQFNHQLTVRDQFNFSTVEEFSKFEFTDTSWENIKNRGDSLIITHPQDQISPQANIVKTIYNPNGTPAFIIIAN